VRILAVSDREEPILHEYFERERWGQIDLIISCGDLPPDYLEFLESSFNVPLFYVRGNHDLTYDEERPGGCDNLDGKVVKFAGLRFLGLQGSFFYGGRDLQYTEGQMRRKIWGSLPSVWLAGGIDVVVTHAPPRYCEDDECSRPHGYGLACARHDERTCADASDIPHRGFRSLRGLMLKHKPRYLLHGHTHLNYRLGTRRREVASTEVIDCYGHVILEIDK